jgi:hypothetical protein
MKYTFVFDPSLLKLQHTKYQERGACFYLCQSGGGALEINWGAKGGASLKKFGNHWSRASTMI